VPRITYLHLVERRAGTVPGHLDANQKIYSLDPAQVGNAVLAATSFGTAARNPCAGIQRSAQPRREEQRNERNPYK